MHEDTSASPDAAIIVSKDRMLDMARTALDKVNVRTDVREAVAQGLVWTSLRGIDSHGVRLLPHYVASVKSGRINPAPDMRFEQRAPSVGTLDADDTFGHAAGITAMRHAISLARESGLGAVAVANSSHCGAMSWFGFEAAKHDMIGLCFTHATPRVISPGAKRAFFGNNPVCMVAPAAGQAPFCFDAATTGITFNRVKAFAAAGLPVPPGMVADAQGNETLDPNKAQLLIPIGGYKGFGLSMVVDILCALLSGMPFGPHVSNMYGEDISPKRKLGHFFCAMNIASFVDPQVFSEQLSQMMQELRSEPAIDPDTPVMAPGDPENAAWEQRSELGIPLPRHTHDAIVALL